LNFWQKTSCLIHTQLLYGLLLYTIEILHKRSYFVKSSDPGNKSWQLWATYIDIWPTKPSTCQDTETKVTWNMKKREGEALFLMESWISILQPTFSLTFIRHDIKHQQSFYFTRPFYLDKWQHSLHLPIYEIQHSLSPRNTKATGNMNYWKALDFLVYNPLSYEVYTAETLYNDSTLQWSGRLNTTNMVCIIWSTTQRQCTIHKKEIREIVTEKKTWLSLFFWKTGIYIKDRCSTLLFFYQYSSVWRQSASTWSGLLYEKWFPHHRQLPW
jgi:hypothetical protein